MGRGIGRGGKIAVSKVVEEEDDKVDKEFDKEQNKVGDNKEVILKRTLEK